MSRNEILEKVASGALSVAQASSMLVSNQTLRCKVSEKGAVSVYGLQRMPVTLYMEQWGRLLDFADNIRQFIKDNEGDLSRKADKAA
jgi:hypothetical protein